MLRYRHFRNRSFGNLTLYNMTLCRIVIHKNKTVRTDVDLRSNFDEIAVLRLPVCLDDEKIIRMKNTVGTV